MSTETPAAAMPERPVAQRVERASLDVLLDPWVMYELVRDEAGAVVGLVFADVNVAACEYFERTRDELVGSRVLDLLPGLVEAGLLASYAEVVDTGTPLVLDAFVYPYELDDRAAHLFDIRAIRVDGLLSLTWRDVTDRVAEQRRLVESDARFRLLAENASDVVVETDHGRLRWVSPSVERVLGWSPTELLGQAVADLLAAADATAVAELQAVVYAGRPIVSHEVRFRTASGELRWMEVHAQPVLDEAGAVAGAVIGLRDVHAEVLARRALTTLSAGNAILVRAESEDALLVDMCETAVARGGYLFSWYGRAVDDPEQTVEAVASAAEHADYLDAVRISWGDGPLGQGPTGTSIRTRTTTILQDLSLESSYAPWFAEATARGFRSSISLPVEIDGEIDGAFVVYAAEPRAFDDVAVALFEDLTAQLGYGLNRLRERAELDRALASAVDLLAAAVESRDAYTAGHQARVARLAVAIGHELGFDAGRLEGLEYGATIHDIGKNAVPIAILARPGRLPEEEMALVRRHAEVGWEIASRFEWPWPIAEMIHQHHERMDGSGYPQGLLGDEILLEARIIAVADVFEAIGSDRPYRRALGFDRARAIVVEGSGPQFDPVVVAAFERVLDDGFSFDQSASVR